MSCGHKVCPPVPNISEAFLERKMPSAGGVVAALDGVALVRENLDPDEFLEWGVDVWLCRV